MEITKEMRERLIARLNRKMLEHKALYLLCNSRFEGGPHNEHWLIREIDRMKLVDCRDLPYQFFEIGANMFVNDDSLAVDRVIYSPGQKRKFLFSKASQTIEVGQLVPAGCR